MAGMLLLRFGQVDEAVHDRDRTGPIFRLALHLFAALARDFVVLGAAVGVRRCPTWIESIRAVRDGAEPDRECPD